jgi:hypothetical protein
MYPSAFNKAQHFKHTLDLLECVSYDSKYKQQIFPHTSSLSAGNAAFYVTQKISFISRIYTCFRMQSINKTPERLTLKIIY